MKLFRALLLASIATAGLVSCQSDEPAGVGPVTGLPWQIDILSDGNIRVFGITPGQTTLGEAVEMLGGDMELAIIAAPGKPGSLEAYYSHFSAGPITGRLILVMDSDAGMLAALQEHAFQDGGTRRFRLHPDDLPAAYRAPVGIVTFQPSYNLDETIARSRFGKPGEVIQVDEQQKHLLYPDKGLDLILNADSRELLQYLSPQAFSTHHAWLRQQHLAPP